MSNITKIDFSRLHAKEKLVMDKIGEIVEKEMQSRAPNETGLMKASIWKEQEGGNGTTITESVGTHGISYAQFVEHFDWAGLHSADFAQIASPTYNMPNYEWLALFRRGQSGSGQSIPFARSASFFTYFERFNAFKEVFK